MIPVLAVLRGGTYFKVRDVVVELMAVEMIYLHITWHRQERSCDETVNRLLRCHPVC
jgi:hypothetical protein